MKAQQITYTLVSNYQFTQGVTPDVLANSNKLP